MAIEVETGEPVVQRFAEAVARFDGVFAPQKERQTAAQFVRGMQFWSQRRGVIIFACCYPSFWLASLALAPVPVVH